MNVLGRTPLTVAALAIAVALVAVAPVADAGKPAGGPSITLDELTIGGPVGAGFCAATIKYTVNGLKGSPGKSWPLGVITADRFNRGTGPDGGGFNTSVTKALNGQQQTHEFTEGLIYVNTTASSNEVWDVRVFVSDPKTTAKIALSNWRTVTIAANSDCTVV